MKIRNSNFFDDPKFEIANIFHRIQKFLKKVRLKYFHFFYKKFI